ncbi:hypothetical protein ACFL54_06525, partial [Planctomycetota bacterium]
DENLEVITAAARRAAEMGMAELAELVHKAMLSAYQGQANDLFISLMSDLTVLNPGKAKDFVESHRQELNNSTPDIRNAATGILLISGHNQLPGLWAEFEDLDRERQMLLVTHLDNDSIAESVNHLQPLQYHKDARIAAAAVQSLIRRARKSEDLPIEAFYREERAGVRTAIVRQLAKADFPDKASLLINMLEPSHITANLLILQSLADFSPGDVKRALMLTLQNPDSVSFYYRQMQPYIATHLDREMATALVEVLWDCRDVYALRSMLGYVQEKFNDIPSDFLKSNLDAANTCQRRRMYLMAAEIGVPELTLKIYQWYEKELDANNKACALFALWKMQYPKIIPLAEKAFYSPRFDLGGIAAAILADREFSGIARTLFEIYQNTKADKNRWMREIKTQSDIFSPSEIWFGTRCSDPEFLMKLLSDCNEASLAPVLRNNFPDFEPWLFNYFRRHIKPGDEKWIWQLWHRHRGPLREIVLCQSAGRQTKYTEYLRQNILNLNNFNNHWPGRTRMLDFVISRGYLFSAADALQLLTGNNNWFQGRAWFILGRTGEGVLTGNALSALSHKNFRSQCGGIYYLLSVLNPEWRQ